MEQTTADRWRSYRCRVMPLQLDLQRDWVVRDAGDILTVVEEIGALDRLPTRGSWRITCLGRSVSEYGGLTDAAELLRLFGEGFAGADLSPTAAGRVRTAGSTHRAEAELRLEEPEGPSRQVSLVALVLDPFAAILIAECTGLEAWPSSLARVCRSVHIAR